MKIKPSILIIFLIVLFILAGLIFLSLRLSEEQRRQRVAMQGTEQALRLLTNNDLGPEANLVMDTPTITNTLTPEPSLTAINPTQTSMETSVNTSSGQVTSTSTATTVIDPAVISTPTNTSVPEVLPTSTPSEEIFTPFDWTGQWTAFFGDEGGILFRATLVISREGNTIIGVHGTQIFTGALSEDGLSVIGTWVNSPTSGEFGWTIVGENQFCGNTEGAFAYCGARYGASRPDPCRCLQPVE
jgi:hypothetical protein